MNHTNNKITLFTVLLTFAHFITLAQSNGGFETNDADGCRNASGTSFTIVPFNKGKVSSWNASHGTPRIQKSSSNCVAAEADVNSGTEAAFIFFSETNKEGIFQSISIKKDESFNVALFAKALDANSKVMIKFANGLANEDPVISGGNPNIPNPSSQQLVIEQTLTNSWQEVRIDEIIADADYSQVWIYAMDGTILVDDFSFFKSCCEPFKLWHYITNPPSTYVNNYIKAGENVDASQPTGKVLITADSEPIVFQAGKNIELGPGFETELGAVFTAEIIDCGEKELEITIESTNPYVQGDPNSIYCNAQFQAAACFGSGDYTFSWDNGSGADRTDPNDATKTESIAFSVPQWLFVRVIDNVTGVTYSKGIHIDPVIQLFGPFTIDIFNVITPPLNGTSGDGLNDEWVAEDRTRINSQTNGYNAFSYSLKLFNRWGERLYKREKESYRVGFPWNDIRWPENACDELGGSGTVFGILNLKNCDRDETIEFIIEVICTTSEPNRTLNIDSLSASVLLIYPNPTNSTINIISTADKPKHIELYSSAGSLVLSEDYTIDSEVKIDVSIFPPGYYTLKVLSTQNKIITKGIIIK